MDEKGLKKLQEKATQAESDALVWERSENKAKKDLEGLETKIRIATNRLNGEVSEKLKLFEQNLKKKESVLRNNEQEFIRRSDSLETKEKRFLHLSDKEKKLRNKALDVESRNYEAEKLWAKAVTMDADGKTKLGEAIKKEEELIAKETLIASQIQVLSVKKNELDMAKEDYNRAKENYEMIKKEIGPKLEMQKSQLELLAEKQKSIKQKEEVLEAEKDEVKKIREVLGQENEILEAERYKIKELKIELNNKVLGLKIEPLKV